MIAVALTVFTIFFTLTGTFVHAQIPAPTVLHDFFGPTDFTIPAGIVAQGRDGNLYGTAYGGSFGGAAGVYKITPSGTETMLVTGLPSCVGLSLGFDGNFYGTCQQGGANNYGYVFRVTPTGTLTDIYDFTNTNGDSGPTTVPVLGANGDFYGTTPCGNVYRVTTAGVYKNIKSGQGYCNFTQLSAASNGDFYGTWNDVPQPGTFFKVTAAGAYDEFYDASGASFYPTNSPILASDGELYGTDAGGGTLGYGAIYSLTANGKTFTDLYNNAPATSGDFGGYSLLQASDGNFYGTSYNNGPNGTGGFFELTSDNVFSLFADPASNASPAPTTGCNPESPMMQHTNGLLYSTNSTCGAGPLGFQYDGAFLSFDIGAAPFIALVGPVPAATEGTQVQILGQNFTSSSEVEFAGVKATKVSLTGSTFIEATVPTGALTGKITVTTKSVTLSTLVTFDITPTVSAISPTSGPAGTEVTITGTGLTQASTVEFHGTKATFTVNSDSQITATLPSGATTGAISITTEGGSASSKTFTVN